MPLAPQRVLAFLALQDRPVQRCYVAGKLWSGGSQEHAHGNLRSALWRIRAAAPELVDSSRTQLRLASEVAVDVSAQVELCRRLMGAPRALDFEGRSLIVRRLLPDWYDAWVDGQRQRLAELCLLALEATAQRLLERGEHAAAAGAAVTCLEIDPLREAPHLLAIRAYLSAGQRADARRQYERYRRLCGNGLGIVTAPLDVLADAATSGLLGAVRRFGDAPLTPR